ncbi:MAG: hypothetical protein K5841_05020 [Fretibacterium sp.]|nr:hypothetical protein [Fretibacterium sp.]
MIEYSSGNILGWTRLGMRKAFGAMLQAAAAEHEDIIVLAADVASSAGLMEFAEQFPDRFYNIGIAEQNMLGIAAGLAKEGNNVFVVSFAPFVSMRAYEAVRTLVGYMNLNVKIVALASGLSLGSQGNTHFCLEDISIMRTIPGMTLLSPADCLEEAKCIEYLADHSGPAFLRLTGIDGTPMVYRDGCDFKAGVPNILREGADVAVLGTGSVVSECLRLARSFKNEGLTCSVVDVHTLKPFDSEIVRHLARTHRLLLSVEEHFISGGLGSLTAEALSTMGHHAPLVKAGIEDAFPCPGDYSFMLKECGLTAAGLKEKIMAFFPPQSEAEEGRQ